MRRMTIVTILLFSSLPIISASQTKPLVAPADYGQWETLGPTALSPDGKSNQIDYHRRIHEWFGHYLKNEPAAPWIAKGLSFLEREQELKRLKTQKGKN